MRTAVNYFTGKSKANETLAAEFGLAANTYLFHSVMLHFENDEPIQVEER